jgi:hypothetical protein
LNAPKAKLPRYATQASRDWSMKWCGFFVLFADPLDRLRGFQGSRISHNWF